MALESLILDADSMDLSEYYAQTDAGHVIKPAASWSEQLIDEVNGKSEYSRVCHLPWRKIATQFAFRPGEVSLYFGFNGGGKSLLTGQVMLSLIQQGERACIASFEMKPRRTLARMLRQWAGCQVEQVGPAGVLEFLDWCDGKLFLYDQTGRAVARTLVAAIRWSAKNKGITQFVVDNLNKCVRGTEDYDEQKNFVDELTIAARELNIHIHLVHHPRKAEDESRPPRKMDSKGAGEVIDMVDNVIVTWKNKPKIEATQRGDHSKANEPDQLVIIDKQRNGEGWEGRLALWWHHTAWQYVETPASGAQDYRTDFPHLDRTLFVPTVHL